MSVILSVFGPCIDGSLNTLFTFLSYLTFEHTIFDKLVEYAIKYFNDVVKPKKQFKKPYTDEKNALKELANHLMKCKYDMDPEGIQTIVYSVGKKTGYAENLREWFKLIYQVIFGDEEGPRMGFFISFFGF